MSKSKNRNKKSISRKRNYPKAAIGFSNPLVILGLTIIALIFASNVQTTQNLTASAQSVLGEDEQTEEQKQAEEASKESAKQAEEAQKESAKQAEEQQKEAAKTTTTNSSGSSGSSNDSMKTKTETVTSSGLKIKTESERNKQETEIETADGQKIKTKIEDDGTTKIEIENGTLKLKYKVENGQVVLKAENETGEDVELESDEMEKLQDAVEEELEDDDVKLVPAANNQLAVTKNQVAAVTDFPLTIDIVTKQLIVTTPEGQKIVTILPDQAVQNLLATGIVNAIEQNTDSTIQEQLGTLNGVVKLEIRNGEVIYRVNGTKNYKIFGFVPVNSPVTAFVSADTGNTIAKQQSILTNLVDLLSP